MNLNHYTVKFESKTESVFECEKSKYDSTSNFQEILPQKCGKV